jgi:hypothetical protein
MADRASAPVIEALRARGVGARRQVLVSLNGLESDAFLDELARSIADARDDLFFWIRMHPCRLDGREALRQRLGGPAAPFELDVATDAPLYTLFPRVQVHATEGSTTALEAAAFGVPTVLLTPADAALYPELVAEGWARAISGPAQLSAAARTIGAPARPWGGAQPDPEGAIDGMLALRPSA